MKKNYVLACLIMLCGNVCSLSLADTQKSSDPAKIPGLISKWLFNEGSGSLLMDVTGVNNISASSLKWVDGIEGKALDISRGCVSILGNKSLSPEDEITLSVWVKPSMPINKDTKKINVLFSRGCTGSGSLGINLWFHSGGLLFFYIGSNKNESNSFGWHECSKEVNLETGTWYHVAATKQGQNMKIFLNGEKIMETNSDPFKLAWDPKQYLTIGGYPGTDWDFCGALDEPAIYSKALSDNEIMQLYKAHSAAAPE